MIIRAIEGTIRDDLNKKMVLLSGPRQCGKTTLAKSLFSNKKSTYYNWDVLTHRRLLQQGQLETNTTYWIFDELHKYHRWKNWLKGIYDLEHKNHSILVTGSANLRVYSRGGDSLQGRYFAHHLHPFTLREVTGRPAISDLDMIPLLDESPKAADRSLLDALLLFGGFPEPFVSHSKTHADRWRLSYSEQLIRDEIRNLESLKDLDRVELLFDRLTETVGSVLSINSLREDLEVAFKSVKSWIDVFDNLYATFRIAPFGTPRIKAVKKEQKLYFWDWSRIEDPAKRFENAIAAHLLRLVDWARDTQGQKWELRYFRDINGREVDFIILRNAKPWMAIEVKSSETSVSPHLKYLLERVKIPHAFQVSLDSKTDWKTEPINGTAIRMTSATRFLLALA